MIQRHSLLLPLLSFAVACGTEPAARAGITVAPDGRVHVTNTGQSAWSSEGAWTLEEDLRIGSRDQAGPEQFARIDAVLSDSEGRIYVLELMSQQIRVFRADGGFSHKIGGPGRGPGEFMDANIMTWGRGDTLWVMDLHANRRYSAFDRSGKFLTSHPRQLGSGALTGRFLPDGRYVDWITSFPDAGQDGIAGARLVHHPVRWSANFQSADTLPPLEFEREMVAHGSLPQLFFRASLQADQDALGRLWFAHTRDYRVFQRSLEGDTTLVFTLPAKAKPIEDEDRDYIRARMENSEDRGAAYLEGLAPAKPVIHRVLADNAGHVWVVPEVDGVATGSVIDVFRDTGEYLGRLRLPTPVAVVPSAVLHLTRDYAYYVTTDEYDVPFVIRARIRRS